MTDIQHINVDDEQWDGTPRALREHVDKLQKALKDASQKITGYETERASSALSGVLTGFKNPERVKTDLLSDKVDPLDSEAVTKWLEKNGDDYAKGEANPEPPAPADQADSQAAQYAALQLGSEYRPAADIGKLDVVKSQLPPDATKEQVAAALREAGV